jgi:hypothetical protein
MDNPAESSERAMHICKSCGNHFQGMYCNACGEKILSPGDRSFKHFMSDVIRSLTFDNKFIKTLKYIIVRPGFISREFAEGRRVKYLKPLQLFFILNLIYFLFPLLQLFNTSLNTQMYLRTHSPLVRNLVNQELAEKGYSYQGYSLMYNEKSTSLAKLLVIVFVFFAALPFTIIYSKRNRFFADHLTLSVELATFNLAMNALFLSIFLVLVNNIIHWTHAGWQKYLDDVTLTLIFVLTNIYFLFSAGRVFYNQKGFKLIIKVILGLLGLFVALELYRLVLFLLTYWSI